MSRWSALPWQQDAWRQLQQALESDRLTHAWLISGPEGVGKHVFVRALSARLLCTRAADWACGQCHSCRLLASGAHPDAHLLSLEGHTGIVASDRPEAELFDDESLSFWRPKPSSAKREIAVDAARSLIEKLTTVPHLGGRRVVVVSPAAELSESAANALLKTIEEPPERTTLLLVSEAPLAIKQTLRSRCQQLRMARPNRMEALQWLMTTVGGDDAALEQALDEASGSPLTARAWLAAGVLDERRLWRDLLTRVATRKLDPLSAAAELGRDRDTVLRFMRFWIGELSARLRAQVKLAQHWTPAEERFLQALTEAIRRVDYVNAAPQLQLESLLMGYRALSSL